MDLEAPHDRSVRIQTTFGTFEGSLLSSGMLRLLDDLNVVAKNFLTVHDAIALSGHWASGNGPVTINKSTVLFVQELPGCPPPPGNRRISNRFTRTLVEILMPDYAVQGFVHVPPQGDPLSRFNQGHHAFVALTSGSVVGPGEGFATSFLAVNRHRVLAARAIERPDPSSLAEPCVTELVAPLEDPTGS